MPVQPTEEINMITELLTPLVLAAAPTIVEVDTSARYDHSKQVVEAQLDGKAIGLTMMGTQTYGADGRPFDNDAD